MDSRLRQQNLVRTRVCWDLLSVCSLKINYKTHGFRFSFYKVFSKSYCMVYLPGAVEISGEKQTVTNDPALPCDVHVKSRESGKRLQSGPSFRNHRWVMRCWEGMWRWATGLRVGRVASPPEQLQCYHPPDHFFRVLARVSLTGWRKYRKIRYIIYKSLWI